MMAITNINEGKELAVAFRPVVFVDFVFPDGTAYYVASIGATFNGHLYDARIDDQQIERLASLSEQGIDRVPSATIVLADPSASVFNSYDRGHGFKGASMTLRFALYDPPSGNFTTDNFVPFVGTCDEPSSDDKNLTVPAQSKLNLSQYMLPQAPIQVRCIWINPTTTAQRAVADSAASLYYPCGETRDLAAAPPCAYTKQTCTRPRRYSGSTWAPGQTDAGVNYISGKNESWRNADTSGKYKEYWPVWLGGKAWVSVVPLNQFGDGNYTRGEAAVGIGEVDVARVIVNGVELSQNTLYATPGAKDYCWSYVNLGYRDGTPNPDAGYNGKGDPYGGLTVIEYRAPKTVIPPETPATVMVLGERAVGGHLVTQSSIAVASVQAGISGNPGPIIIRFGRVLAGTADPGDQSAITIAGCSFAAANGSWIMELLELPYDHATLRGSMAYGSGGACTAYFNQSNQSGGGPTPGLIQETMRLCGISAAELSAPMMAVANAICNANITGTDGGGNTYTEPRFTSAVAVRQRRSAGEIVRGLRQSVGGILTVDNAGLIGMRIEGPLAEQQGAPVDGSNTATPITSTLRDGSTANGYPAYRFDESNAWGLKRAGQPVAQMPNRVTFSFQDPVQQYAISTFSLVDSDDVARVGREISGGLQVNPEGIGSYNHALRCGRLGLNKIHRGNPAGDTRGTDWWEWKSSFRACRLRIGDIVTLNNTRYNLIEQMVRITEIKPSKNFEIMDLKGHHHEDSWYLDSHGNAADPAFSATPHPNLGATVPPTYAIGVSALDGTVAQVLNLSFSDPANTYSITAGTFTFHFVIETDIATTLAAAITDLAAGSITVVNASAIHAGDYLQIGGEVVLCGTPAGTVVPITRAQLATTAATALLGASIWAVQQTVSTASFPLDFVNSAAILDWTLSQALPGTKLLAVGGSVTNAFGESQVRFVCLTNTPNQGLPLSATSGVNTLVPPANIDYHLPNGDLVVLVTATSAVHGPVLIYLPQEAPDRSATVTVKWLDGNTQDVQVVRNAIFGDTIDGLTAPIVLSAAQKVWTGVAQ